MDYKNFKEIIMQKVSERCSGKYELISHVVRNKNNVGELDALSFRLASSPEMPSPTIYLRSLYEDYIDKAADLDSMADDVLRMVDDAVKNSPVEMNIVDKLLDYEAVKDMIVPAVIGVKNNGQLLEDVYHKEIPDTDLIIIYRVIVKKDECGLASTLVTNALLAKWGILPETIEEISDLAVANANRIFSLGCSSVFDVLKEFDMAQPDGFEEILEESELMPPQYILRYKDYNYGAAVLADNVALKKMGDIYGKDFYILPSSIAEIICTPCDETCDKDYLKMMVRDINQTSVAPNEVLSDNVYLYRRDTGKIIAC